MSILYYMYEKMKTQMETSLFKNALFSVNKILPHSQQQPDSGFLLWSVWRAPCWCFWGHFCQLWKEKVSEAYLFITFTFSQKLVWMHSFCTLYFTFSILLSSLLQVSSLLYTCSDPHFVSVFCRKNRGNRQKQLIPKVKR